MTPHYSEQVILWAVLLSLLALMLGARWVALALT